MGKGDNPRPLSIPPEEFEERWEQTFGSPGKETLMGTTFWPCPRCGEAINRRTARTHECEGEDE